MERTDRNRWWTSCGLAWLLGVTLLHAQTPPARDWYGEGRHSLQARQYRAAAESFGRAAAADALSGTSAHPDAPLLEARARCELGEYPAAERAVAVYLRANPRSADGLYLLAFTQQRQNRPRESLATYNAAAAVQAPTAEQLRQVSLSYVLLNDYRDALQWLERSVSSDPKNPEALYDLARVQMHEGRFDPAIDSLHRSLALRPGDPRALGNLGKCLENQNRTEEAEQTYASAVAAAAARPVEEPYLDYGALLNTHNRSREALPLLKRAIELAPGDFHAWEELGRAHIALHDTGEAEAALVQAVKLDPGNSRLHYQLARVYRSNGKEAQATQEFARSAQLYGGKSAE